VVAGEARRYEERIAGLKRQAHGFEGQGEGREADSQAAGLAAVGAALGLYFATGHVRSGPPARGRAVTEGGTLTVLPQGRPRAAARQIAPATRRVPLAKRICVGRQAGSCSSIWSPEQKDAPKGFFLRADPGSRLRAD
jgi:hypothetical protein